MKLIGTGYMTSQRGWFFLQQVLDLCSFLSKDPEDARGLHGLRGEQDKQSIVNYYVNKLWWLGKSKKL